MEVVASLSEGGAPIVTSPFANIANTSAPMA